MIAVRDYNEEDFLGVRSLWEEVFPNDPPWNAADVAIPQMIAAGAHALLVADDDGEIVGTIFAGFDGHRGWLHKLAVRTSRQRMGIGALLVEQAERRLKDLGCGKVNLQVRSTNMSVIDFYRRLGFEVEERVSLGKRIAL